MKISCEILTKDFLHTQFSSRQRVANKGDFGHVLVIGGEEGMGGATRLAAEAALRVGAGLVSVATRPMNVSLVSSSCPEIMCHPIHSEKELAPLLARATVVVIGSGLGKSAWSKALFEMIHTISKPILMDADAINILSEQENQIKKFHWILTPHPGEAARLLKCTPTTIQENRYLSAKKIMECYGGVCVLKGAETIITAENEIPALCPFGNPGMATAGMGDVLSGVIGGLLAQQFSLFSAAKTGVLLHALAGDAAAAIHGERGLLASDLMIPLHQLVNFS